MNKEQLVQMIEAYADAKASNNNYLVSLVAQQLTDAINFLFPPEEEVLEDVSKGSGTKVSRAK